MSVFVKASETLEEGVNALMGGAVEDYTKYQKESIALNWGEQHIEQRDQYEAESIEKFTNGMRSTKGAKYIKVMSENRVHCFIVATSNDDKFNLGDVLSPATWARPARNRARGNVLTTGTHIQWTGPLYLR